MTLDEAKKVAEQHGFELGQNAVGILRGIDKNDGCCICRAGKIKCPCPFMAEDVVKDGECLCALFKEKG